jgi:hypothetical protein
MGEFLGNAAVSVRRASNMRRPHPNLQLDITHYIVEFLAFVGGACREGDTLPR